LWFLAGIILTCGIGCIFVAAINWWIQREARRYVFTSLDNVPKNEVALVLGASIRGPRKLSMMLADRVDSAIELYKAGKVKKLLMSGDNSATDYDEVSAMRRYALKHGVDSDDILRDFAGFRTYDSMYRARELWGLHSMIIVTQGFHLTRAVYTARHLGIDAYGYIADRSIYGRRALLWSNFREIAARTLAWLEVHITHPKPKFLGEPQTLSGDRQTSEVERTNP
jgi:SanA protein